jgi:HEAT repeat protein
VAFALGQLRDPRATDALMTALKDQNAEVRRQAAFALGQLLR